MHDFTPKEKKRREERKETKDIEDKVFLFLRYLDKRAWQNEKQEEGWTGCTSSSDSI